MKRQAFQPGEIRDNNDNIIREGAYGKKTALATSDNMGILDYIINNFDALYDAMNGGRVYVKSAADLPKNGDAAAVYIAEDTGKWYYWNPGTSTYVTMDNARAILDQMLDALDKAQKNEEAAASSATAAKTSETNAKASEASASASATSAKSWAEDKDSPDGIADTDSPTGYTQSAKSWALAAQTSAASASAHLDEINRPVYYLDSDGCLCEKIFVEVTE